jgi:hypothetical protein
MANTGKTEIEIDMATSNLRFIGLVVVVIFAAGGIYQALAANVEANTESISKAIEVGAETNARQDKELEQSRLHDAKIETKLEGMDATLGRIEEKLDDL